LSLRDYLRVLRKRWRPIVAVLLVCVLAGAAYLLSSTKKYEATAQIFVSTAGAGATTAADLNSGNTFTQARVQSYTSVANSPAVTEPVLKQLGLSMGADALASEISADAPLNKVLINLHVTDRDPVQAAGLANAVAAQFSKVVEDLEQTNTTQPSPVKLTVTQPAQVPTSPSSPRPKLDIALAILVGLVLGLGFAFLREMLDNTVKDPDELATQSALPVLGMIPWDKRAAKVPISFRADAHGSRAEGYRQLRTNLQFVDVDNPPKVIAVTIPPTRGQVTHGAQPGGGVGRGRAAGLPHRGRPPQAFVS
jgi:capsular polysaccharide biosynthesis protein